jgi:hypothetical protein
MPEIPPPRHDCHKEQKPLNWLKVKSVSGFPRSAVGDFAPAVVVHRLTDALRALSVGLPITLLSGSGAGLYAGCGWWRGLVDQARAAYPGIAVADILDCAEGSGQALAALRIGQRFLVLWPSAPGWGAVAAIAAEYGGAVLPAAPSALDLAARGSERRLHDWLRAGTTAGDSRPPLG